MTTSEEFNSAPWRDKTVVDQTNGNINDKVFEQARRFFEFRYSDDPAVMWLLGRSEQMLKRILTQ